MGSNAAFCANLTRRQTYHDRPSADQTYATDAAVTTGSVFSLVFDITPREGIHVYAPGDHPY